MCKRKKTNNHKPDRCNRIILLAELTHQLTGEEESDIRGYLEKFGIDAFISRLNRSDMTSDVKTILNEKCRNIE